MSAQEPATPGERDGGSRHGPPAVQPTRGDASPVRAGGRPATTRAAGPETGVHHVGYTLAPDAALSANVTLTRQDGALHVHFGSRAEFAASVVFRPDQPLDLSGSTSVGMVLDLSNPTDRSAQLLVELSAANGVATRSLTVPAHSRGTYYVDIASPAVRIDSGMRADPSWLADKGIRQAVWMWDTKEIDPASLVQVALFVTGLLHDREIVVHDLRISRDAPADHHLTGLIDRFGQNTRAEIEGKVTDPGDLLTHAAAEADDLAAHPPLADRSTFGGWATGPRLEATGYFRTAKVDGRWTLVDPEGHLYWSTGVDNTRLLDGQTMTGYDVDHTTLETFPGRSRTAASPEDLNQVATATLPTRRVVNPLRAGLFEDLPEYGQRYGAHYGYAPETFAGPLGRGETYHFYRSNLDRNYGSDDGSANFLDRWRTKTVDRMLSWGFTSLGNWTDPKQYRNGRIPYVAHGWIHGDVATVSTGQDYWGPLPDPFDPGFVAAARATAEAVAAETGDDPWHVGVFMDNEHSWGNASSFETHYGLVLDTLDRDSASSPTKAEFSRLLKKKYGTVDRLNRGWSPSLHSL